MKQSGVTRTKIKNLTVQNRRNKTLFQHLASAMGTQKWHALDNFSDSLERLGDIRFSHADFYKADTKV